MGAICTKPNTANVTNPAQFNSQGEIPSVASGPPLLEEILYINSKYKDFFSIMKTSYLGEGIKRTYSYKSHVSQDELFKKREEFWDTRTEGVPEAWQTIRACVSQDEASAIVFLKASGLEMVQNSIQYILDETGRKYEIPIFCINDPESYDIKEIKESSRPMNFQKANIEIRIRCAKLQNDLTFKIENSISAKELKELFRLKATAIPEIESLVIRLFFRGKELKDGHFIGEYEIGNEDMLQIFLQNKS